MTISADDLEKRYGKFWTQRAFTIIEEDSVVDEVERAVSEFPSANDIFDAAKWRIARDPNSGKPIPGTNPEKKVITLPSFRIVKSPKLVVRYFFENEYEICIDWVKFYPYDDSEAVSPPAYVYR